MLIAPFSWALYLFTAVAFAALAVHIADEAEKLYQVKDASAIVIDEIAGMLCTFFLVSPTVVHLALGFCLFRCFDIVKLFPADWCQRRLPGGLGVVADDLAAGIYANLVLLALICYFGI